MTALIKRELSAEGKPAANHKKVYRLMRAHQLLLSSHILQPILNDRAIGDRNASSFEGVAQCSLPAANYDLCFFQK